MTDLPNAILHIFALFAPLFSRPVYSNALNLMVAHFLYTGKRSVTNLIGSLGKHADSKFTKYFYVLQMYLKSPEAEYFIVDSFPVRAYQNHKTFRARIFRKKCYRGHTASKKAYFFGLKVHMIIDEHGLPIEFCITPGCHC